MSLHVEARPSGLRPTRRPVLVAVTLAIMALSAGGIWAAWRILGHHSVGGAVPVIRADDRPVKVPPDNPGGLAVPDQNLYVLNGGKPADSRIEQLLPPPETPLPRPTAPAVTDTPAPPPATLDAAPVANAVPAPTSASAANAMPATIMASTANAAAVPPPAPVANAMPATITASAANAVPTPARALIANAVPAPPLAPAAAPASAPIVAAAAASALSAAPAASTAPVRAAAAPAPAPADGYRLQIAAVRSEDAAKAEWARLQHAEADILGPLEVRTVRADLGERGVFYRLEAGPIADQAAAERACATLKERKVGCILVRR